jgi:ABC-type oligopeptide transport system ATPase subunit
MGKSPSLDVINDNFLNIKDKLNKKKKITFLFVILYLFLSLYLLIKYKPKMVCKNNTTDFIDDRKTISYTKFVLYYLLIQIPLFLYIII